MHIFNSFLNTLCCDSERVVKSHVPTTENFRHLPIEVGPIPKYTIRSKTGGSTKYIAFSRSKMVGTNFVFMYVLHFENQLRIEKTETFLFTFLYVYVIHMVIINRR